MAEANPIQMSLLLGAASFEQIRDVILDVLALRCQPSAWELVSTVEEKLGWKARWGVKAAVEKMIEPPTRKNAWRDYLESLAHSGDLDEVLRGSDAPKRNIESSIDGLLRHTKIYQCSDQFQEMIGFMAKFRDYAPYNNMLVRIQDPTCSFYATARDWNDRFKRKLKEDARPILILAPMHPVMLVYSLDQTEGTDLPEELNKFGRFCGEWNPDWLQRTIRNAGTHDHIRVDLKILSSTNAGFATLARGHNDWKMRIAIHEGLDLPSRFGVLCHELAHIYLGHLGTDRDHWWPSRTDLDGRALEIEAEATAFVVTSRFGLVGSSAAYVSRYLGRGPLPTSVSLDQIAKVAGRIEQMAYRPLGERKGAVRVPASSQQR